MILNKLAQLPAVPNCGRGSLTVDIEHPGPVLEEKILGTIPRDYYYSSPESLTVFPFPLGSSKIALNPYGEGQEIRFGQPKLNAEGEPIMRTTTTHLVARPIHHHLFATALPFCMLGASASVGAVGTLLGWQSGPLLMGGGALIGVGLGLAVGAWQNTQKNSKERVRLEWAQTPINAGELVAYSADVWKLEGMTRHQHRPLIEKHQVGEYLQPQVVHYQVA